MAKKKQSIDVLRVVISRIVDGATDDQVSDVLKTVNSDANWKTDVLIRDAKDEIAKYSGGRGYEFGLRKMQLEKTLADAAKDGDNSIRMSALKELIALEGLRGAEQVGEGDKEAGVKSISDMVRSYLAKVVNAKNGAPIEELLRLAVQKIVDLTAIAEGASKK